MRLSTVVLSLAIPFAGLAAPSSSQPRNGPESLAALYELGGAVADENGDGVADRLRARLVLADAPSAGEVAAAAEIAARLGLETMALDLPLPDAAPLAITVGDEALRGAGVSGIAELAPGRGAVELHSVGGTTVVGVRGGSPAGLSAAARWLASRAPRVFLTGGETLSEVEAAVLEAAGEAATGVRTVRVEMEADAFALALAEVRVAAGDAGAAAGIASAVEAAGDDLRFDSLAALRVVATHPGGETPVSVGHDPPAPEPGPVPARPGTGPKTDLGLGALYEPDGILGDSNGDRIPDRLDSRLVLTAEDPAGALAFAARLGLESSGMDFPVAAAAGEVAEPEELPTPVLIGTPGGNPLLADLLADGDLPDLAAGEGFIGVIPEAYGKKAAIAITGGDRAGLARALHQAAVGLPHLDAHHRNPDHPTVDAVEFAAWKFLSRRSPAGQAAAAAYSLERIAGEIAHLGVESSRILVSVKDPAPGLDRFLEETAARLGLGGASVELDDRNVDSAAVIHEEEFAVPSEVAEFRTLVRDRLLPAVGRGDRVRVVAHLSEPAEVRAALREELATELEGRGAAVRPGDLAILSAYRQGYGWIEEVVLPRLLELRDGGTPPARVRLLFRRHRPPADWPQQAMHTPAALPARDVPRRRDPRRGAGARPAAGGLRDAGRGGRSRLPGGGRGRGRGGAAQRGVRAPPRFPAVPRPLPGLRVDPGHDRRHHRRGGRAPGAGRADPHRRRGFLGPLPVRHPRPALRLPDGAPRRKAAGPAGRALFRPTQGGALAVGAGASARGRAGDRVHPRRPPRGHLLRHPHLPAPPRPQLAGNRADLRRAGDPGDAPEDRRDPRNRADPPHRIPHRPSRDRGGLHRGRRPGRRGAAEPPQGRGGPAAGDVGAGRRRERRRVEPQAARQGGYRRGRTGLLRLPARRGRGR